MLEGKIEFVLKGEQQKEKPGTRTADNVPATLSERAKSTIITFKNHQLTQTPLEYGGLQQRCPNPLHGTEMLNPTLSTRVLRTGGGVTFVIKHVSGTGLSAFRYPT